MEVAILVRSVKPVSSTANPDCGEALAKLRNDAGGYTWALAPNASSLAAQRNGRYGTMF